MNFRLIAAFVLGSGITMGALAQEPPITVSIETVSGQSQTTSVGSLFDEPFVARVVRSGNVPVAGVRVFVFPNYVTCLPLHPTCTAPPTAMYGEFEPPTGAMITDAQGLITTPGFRAGSVSGQYEVAIMIDANQPGIEVLPGQYTARFQVTQVGGGTANQVPGPGIPALLLLVLAVMGGFWIQSRR